MLSYLPLSNSGELRKRLEKFKRKFKHMDKEEFKIVSLAVLLSAVILIAILSLWEMIKGWF